MTPEGRIKVAVKRRLDKLKAYHYWPVQTMYSRRCLDCIGCYQGLFFGIETKAPGEEMTLHQTLTASWIKEAGGIVLLIDSIEKANDITFDHSIKT